jgi:hypothetical protein
VDTTALPCRCRQWRKWSAPPDWRSCRFAALWLAAERVLWLASWRFVFAVLTLVITAAVWALTSIVAVIQSGAALGFAMLVLGALAARKIRTVLTGLREPSRERMHALPIYLVFVPIAVALLQLAVIGAAARSL